MDAANVPVPLKTSAFTDLASDSRAWASAWLDALGSTSAVFRGLQRQHCRATGFQGRSAVDMTYLTAITTGESHP